MPYLGLEELDESCKIVLILSAVSFQILTDNTVTLATHCLVMVTKMERDSLTQCASLLYSRYQLCIFCWLVQNISQLL